MTAESYNERAALPELDVLVSTENRDPYTYL